MPINSGGGGGGTTLGGVTTVTGTPTAGQVIIASSGSAAAWGNASLTQLFASTLGADTASIDTGAGGFSGAFSALLVFLYSRTDEAVALSVLNITANNDSGANYDRYTVSGTGTTTTSGGAFGGTAWQLQTVGASGVANYFGVLRLTFPVYAGTTGFKVGESTGAVATQANANSRADTDVLAYRSTSAITRLAVTPATGGAKLKAGSTLLVYGLQ